MESPCVKKRSLRSVALASIALATISVVATVITVPLVYRHVQQLQSVMTNEVEFCKIRSRDMWREMVTVQSATVAGEARIARKTKRDAYGAQPIESASPPSSMAGSCCTCQDVMVVPELLEDLVILDRLEEMVLCFPDHHLNHHAKNAHQDRQDQPDHLDLKVFLALKEILEILVKTAYPVFLDRQDLQDPKDLQEFQERKDQLVNLEKSSMELHQDLPDRQDHQDPKVPPGHLERTDNQESPDHQDHQEIPERREPMDCLDLTEDQDHEDHLDSQDLATTAHLRAPGQATLASVKKTIIAAANKYIISSSLLRGR
ncbi:unnamed protein product [Caenorhabditis auriculariae]|uniref:Nematode cuticle collagen N-terminal domain-containing protein n=1 Tax=Caenorhabditis auriculariae TaxID=2777116 RepID=A0A8S1GWG5_9PELO|nr:unnamed protein product [Caenorhabditis auriculariae]